MKKPNQAGKKGSKIKGGKQSGLNPIGAAKAVADGEDYVRIELRNRGDATLVCSLRFTREEWSAFELASTAQRLNAHEFIERAVVRYISEHPAARSQTRSTKGSRRGVKGGGR